MFELLPKERYSEIIPLYEKSSFINAARSHLERTPIAKKVYVDNLEKPNCAAILVRQRIFLGGDHSKSDFLRKLYDHFFFGIREKLASYDIYEIDFYISSNEWIEPVLAIFQNSHIYSRYYYEIKKIKNIDWKDKIPEGYSIHPVDISLLDRKNLVNYVWLIEEIEENWLPFEQNLLENRGYYIVYNNNEIVAWCTTEYLTEDNHIEVGIATRKEHRNKKLATIVGTATSEYCLSRYKSVGWHCSQNNIGSWKTAEKIGFERVREYPKIECFFSEVDHLITLGFQNYLDKNYERAIKCYQKAIDSYDRQTDDAKNSAYLNKWDFTIDKVVMEYAMFHAIVGNQEKCLKSIEKAIELGYDDLEHFEKEDNFKSLQNSKEWENLKTKIVANKVD